jgi:transposase
MPLRREFSCEFKLEAAKPVTGRGVSVAQACRDLDVAESVLRRWMRELAEAPASAFPGRGQMRSEPAEVAALRKEVARLEAERDMPQKRRPRSSRGSRHDVRLLREAPPHLAGRLALRGPGGVSLGRPCLAEQARQRSCDRG